MIAPQEIAARGEQIYQERYRQEYELLHAGKFLAIDVTTPEGKAYLADAPEIALELAQKANPNGFFHILRIGARGVYRVGYTRGNASEWQL